MIVAIDGPAGAGKSTVCRLLARELQFIYLDTGSMYRAVAWALLHEERDPQSEDLVAGSLPDLLLGFAIEDGSLSITYRGRQVLEDLRKPEISHIASLVSSYKAVRDYLNIWQRKLAALGDTVVEGRDMTTVVFPRAEVKVFLTADLSIRTKRRQAEYEQKGLHVEYSSLESQIRALDEADKSRSIAPLRPGPGTLILDTSHMSIAEVVRRLVTMVAAKERI